LVVQVEPIGDSVFIRLCGAATERYVEGAALHFERMLGVRSKVAVVVDLSGTQLIDSRFLALLLLFRKYLKSRGSQLTFIKVPPAIRRVFALNDVSFLLA
jgi:anti-anti-sigma regulatory factor